MPVPDEYPFDASSPVLRYWLVNGVGFAVCRADGRELGVVEDVVVDPLRQHAEQVIVHRRGLIVGRRHARIDARAVEAVSPAAQRFLVESASGDASSGRVAAAAVRLRGLAAFAPVAIRMLARAAPPLGRAMRRAGSDSRALARGLLQRLASGLLLAGGVIGLGARTGAHAAVATGGRVRRESPRLRAWLSSSTRTAATHLAATARVAARGLGDLAVLAAVFVAAAWRRLAAASRSRKPAGRGERRDPDTPQWRSDADAPLGRETGGDAPPPAHEQREATTRRSAGSDRRSDR